MHIADGKMKKKRTVLTHPPSTCCLLFVCASGIFVRKVMSCHALQHAGPTKLPKSYVVNVGETLAPGQTYQISAALSLDHC